MKFRDIPPIFVEAIRTFTPILFILAASTAFSRVLTLMQVPQAVSSFILEHFNSPVMILLVINLFLLIVGMVMDTTPAILILTPILLPIVTAINMDPVQFGVIMVVNLAIGFVTPPIGVNLFVASSLTDVPIMAIAKKSDADDWIVPGGAAADYVYTGFVAGIVIMLNGRLEMLKFRKISYNDLLHRFQAVNGIFHI